MSYSTITVSGIKLVSSNGSTVDTSLLGDGGDFINDNFNYIANNLANTRRSVELIVIDFTTDLAIGDGKSYFYVPSILNGKNLVTINALVITAGTTNTTDIQMARIRAGSPVDMLSTKVTIDSTETSSSTAATLAVINTSNDDIQTGDILRVDIDAISSTAPKGLIVTMEFE